MTDCPIYELPNQSLEHITYAEKEFEDMGADLASNVVFVGGTLYAHNFKARNPEADVTAVEVDPFAAYTHRFAGYQLEQGTSPDQIVEFLFNFGREKQDGQVTEIDSEHYEEIKDVHRQFLEDEEIFGEDFLENVFFMEPDYGAQEVHYSSIENQDPEIDREEDTFLRQERNLFERLINEAKDRHLSIGYRKEAGDTIDRAKEQFHEEKVLDSDELREMAPEPLRDSYDPVESLIHKMQEWKERSHRLHALDEGKYIHATETTEGKVKISKTDRSMGPTHEKLLEEIEQVERPDNIVLRDARNVKMKGDIIFTNNVFSYFNNSEEIAQAIDNLASRDEVFLETTHPVEEKPERVNHIGNPQGQHRDTSLK